MVYLPGRVAACRCRLLRAGRQAKRWLPLPLVDTSLGIPNHLKTRQVGLHLGLTAIELQAGP
jgi:hypothetical protein